MMRNKMKTLLSMILAAALTVTPVMQAAASNQFAMDSLDGARQEVVFPGDEIKGSGPLYIGENADQADMSSGSWTNNTDQAYAIVPLESQTDEAGQTVQGGIQLEALGYVVSVTGGTVKSSDGSADQDNHYMAQDPGENTDPKVDRAYYAQGTSITVTADDPAPGQVFDKWQVDGGDLQLTDDQLASSQLQLSVSDKQIRLTALYRTAETENQADETQAAETQADETQAAETQAAEQPAETSAVTDGEPVVTVEDPENQQEAQTETPAQTETAAQTDAQDGSPAITVVDEGTVDIMGTGDAETEEVQTDTAPAADEQNASPMAYKIISDQTDAGSITVQGGDGAQLDVNAVPAGTKVIVTANANTGYRFRSWEIKTGETPVETQAEGGTENSVSFVMPEGDVNVNGNFTRLFTVTAGEYVTADKTADVASGETVNISVAVPEGKTFEGWKITNTDTQEDVTASLTSDTTGTASFAMPEYPVTVEALLKDTETQPQTQPQTQSETQPQTQSETQPQTQSETQLQTQSETQPQTQSETQLQTETQPGQDDPKAAPVSHTISTAGNAAVTVSVNGAAVTNATAGTTVNLKAVANEGYTFSGWTVTGADGSAVPVSNAQSAEGASFVMPDMDVTVSAAVNEIPQYAVTVENGSGDGSYQAGDYVAIVADEPDPGYRFKGWTVTAGNASIDSPNSESTGFTMPSAAVTVRADYEQIKYDLTVNSGSGDGQYVMGATVNLTADWPASGKEFDKWVVESGDPDLSGADRFYASLVMPDADVTVSASYKDGPDPANNAITGITDGNEYLKGATITFTAAGAGMENTDPNPGDYRYRPTAYQIGSVNGGWSNGNYTTSMAINALGDYTLTVTYAREVFDGNNWTADGTTVTKSVTLRVVNELSVKTGDDTPIIPIAVAGICALAVIILLVAVKRRRR